MRFALGVLPACLVVFHTTASAQVESQPGAARAAIADKDPVVCERLETIGSRLATKKVCMTRSQWADARYQDRAVMEKVQQQRGFIGESSTAPCIAGRTSHC